MTYCALCDDKGWVYTVHVQDLQIRAWSQDYALESSIRAPHIKVACPDIRCYARITYLNELFYGGSDGQDKHFLI